MAISRCLECLIENIVQALHESGRIEDLRALDEERPVEQEPAGVRDQRLVSGRRAPGEDGVDGVELEDRRDVRQVLRAGQASSSGVLLSPVCPLPVMKATGATATRGACPERRFPARCAVAKEAL
jgi:hypothetical protein